MFLERIAFIRSTPCLAEPGSIIVTGEPSRALDPVLPYLAALPDVIGFNPETPTVTFRRKRGFMTLFDHSVTITQVANIQEGVELLAALTEAINATWEHRHTLVKETKRKRPPGHLDIYNLLPQTNCRQCGQATCLAFAVRLLLNELKIKDCLPLQQDPLFNERLKTLESIIS